MRGLTLFLMLFVNDLYVSGVPKWLVHTKANEDGMGLADWVFPGFLFMVGLSIPFALTKRFSSGETKLQSIQHILQRTLSLLLIGILMVNTERFDANLTGMNKNFWVILVYISIFLIWNKYPKESKYDLLFKVLKYSGIILLVAMAAIFKSNEQENQWLSPSWWGILGLIGWGYFASSITYLWLRDNIWPTVFVWFCFLILNLFSDSNFLNFLDPIRSIFGVILGGNVPSIVLAGLIIGLLLKKYIDHPYRFLTIIIPIGLASIVTGFIFRNWFIISKIKATPSWSMICIGISIIVFAILHFLVDRKKKEKWFALFKPAGENSLTTYLAPDIIYYLIWSTYLNLFFYKQDYSPLLAVFGSLIWATIMIYFAAFLAKKSVRLKL
jgi:heparan-alpha-glucosaminide N-acetyltransferase